MATPYEVTFLDPVSWRSLCEGECCSGGSGGGTGSGSGGGTGSGVGVI